MTTIEALMNELENADPVESHFRRIRNGYLLRTFTNNAAKARPRPAAANPPKAPAGGTTTATPDDPYWQPVANYMAEAHGVPRIYDFRVRDYHAALMNYLTAGDEATRNASRAKVDAILNTMSVQKDSEGGFWVTPDMHGRIVSKVFELSPIRQLAYVDETGSDALEGLIDNEEMTDGWVGEEETRTDTAEANIGKWRVSLCEQYAQPSATMQLVSDAGPAFETWLENKLAKRFARKEGTAFVSGTSGKQPRGIITYPTASTSDASRPWGTLQYVPTGAAADFAASNPVDAFYTIQGALKAEFGVNAAWLMNKDTRTTVRKFKDSAGKPIFTDRRSPSEPAMLLGDPVVICPDMPSVAAGTFPIAYGDFYEGYQIVDHRKGMSILVDPFTNRPNVRYYGRRRVGGGVVNFHAIKLMKVAAS